MGLLSSEQTSCCRHDRNHPKMHVSVCLFFIVHLASLGAGQNHSATATNGPLFPTFTLSSPLCAKTLENSTVVVSDSMGNVLASGHGVLCKYKPDGRLDWARHFGNPHTLGEASMSPRLAIGELVSEGQSLRVPGARGSHAVFVTSDDGLYAIDVATGSTLWYYYCGAIRSTPLVVQTARCNATEQKSTEPIRPCSRHTILFGAEDETYHALDFNGTRLWTVNFGGWFGTKYYGWPLRFAASFGGNRFFIMTYRGLAALEVDGKFAWSYAQAPPAVANRGTWSAAIQAKINSLGPVFSNEMIAYSSGEAVNVISSHGKLLGRFMIPKPGSSLGEPPLVDFTTTPTWFGSKILVGDSNSTLYCLKVIGEGRHTAVQWRYHFSQSPDAASSSIRRRRKLMAAELAHVSNVTSNSTNTTDQMAKTNFSPHNSTNMTDSSNDEPIMANSFEPTPVQLQPIWDKPIVSKNGLVYARGPTGLHALDAITGKALWVYSAQPLETDGQLLADFTEVKTDAVSGINFNRMHVRHSRLAATVCGGLGKPDCQAAVSIPDRRSFPDTRNCNVPNISNTTAPNSSDCSSKTHMLPAKIIECGGKLSHGEGHLAMDGSLVFPCRGVLHRVCCAPCLASVIGNNAAYSGENISVLLEGALTPRELTTRLSCLWYDTRNTTGTRLISTAASYGNTSGNVSEAQLVVCNVPGPEESLPQIYLPLRILQQDAAGFLHFCDGERAGIHIKVPVPEPPLSYLMYYILGSAVVITILLFQLSRVLYASYRRQTEYAMIEGEFTKIGLGGLKHEHYLRLLKLLQKWHSRHLPNIFNDWRWAVRLTQLQRRLRLTEEQKIWARDEKEVSQDSVLVMEVKDMDDISHLLSREFEQSPARRARARELLDTVLDKYPHRADLWQLYVDLELQAQEQGAFHNDAGDLCVQVLGAMVCHRQHSEYRVLTACARTKVCTSGMMSTDAVKKRSVHSTSCSLPRASGSRKKGRVQPEESDPAPFVAFSHLSADYKEVKFEESMRFSVHRGFDKEEQEILALQLQTIASTEGMHSTSDEMRRRAEEVRSPAGLTIPKASVLESTIGELNIPVRLIALCRTTLEVEVLEVCGVCTAKRSSLCSLPIPPACRGRISCLIECISSGAEKGHIEKTSWANVTGDGRAKLGSCVGFFLPEEDLEKDLGPSHPLNEDLRHSQRVESTWAVRTSTFANWWPSSDSDEFVLQVGSNASMWGKSAGRENLTTQSTLRRQEERIRREWLHRNRLIFSIYSRESDDRQRPELMGRCCIALKDLELNHVYDQWLPIQEHRTENGYVRVRIRRRKVTKGEMSQPLWMPLESLPRTLVHKNFSDSPSRTYVKVAVGFVPRTPDRLHLHVKHDFEGFSGSQNCVLSKICAIMRVGSMIRRIDLMTEQDMSLEIDDHTTEVQVAILGHSQITPNTPYSTLGEFVILPCLHSGATVHLGDFQEDLSWETVKTYARLWSQVRLARIEGKALFLEWVRRSSNPGARFLSSMQINNALSEYGLGEGTINELLLAADEDCNGEITQHEFVQYGMRFLNPYVAEFHKRMITESAILHHPPDLFKLAFQTNRMLGSVAKPTLSGAISFYFHRFRERVCCCFLSSLWCEQDSTRSNDSLQATTVGSKTDDRKIDSDLHPNWRMISDNRACVSGFSRSMQNVPQVHMVTGYHGSGESQIISVQGTLRINIELVPGQDEEEFDSGDQINTVRALFGRIFNCKELTVRQISRFALQCERWENALQGTNPEAGEYSYSYENEIALSPVVERSFEEGSFEDGFSLENEFFFKGQRRMNALNMKEEKELRPVSARPLLQGLRTTVLTSPTSPSLYSRQDRPYSARPFLMDRPLSGRSSGTRSSSPQDRPFSATSSHFPDRPMSGRSSGSRPRSSNRPRSSHSLKSIGSGDAFQLARNTPAHQKHAHSALLERVMTPNRSRSRITAIPGSPGIFLEKVRRNIMSPPYLGDTAESSSDEETCRDHIFGDAVTRTIPDSRSEIEIEPRPAEARVTRSALLQDKNVPWRELIASRCLTPANMQISSQSVRQNGMFEDSNATNREREQGRSMLRAWSARKFRVSDIQGRQMAGDSKTVSHATRSAQQRPTTAHGSPSNSRHRTKLRENEASWFLNVQGIQHTEITPAQNQILTRSPSAVVEDDEDWVSDHTVPGVLPAPSHKDSVNQVSDRTEFREQLEHGWETTLPKQSLLPARPYTARTSIFIAPSDQSRLQGFDRPHTANVRCPPVTEDTIQLPETVQRPSTAGRFKTMMEGRKKISRDLANLGFGQAGPPATSCDSLGATGSRPSATGVIETAVHPLPTQVGNVSADSAPSAVVGGVLTGEKCNVNSVGVRTVDFTAAGLRINSDSPPRWAREGGITPTIHRLHSKLDDIADADTWRHFENLPREKQDDILSFMKQSDRDAFFNSNKRTESSAFQHLQAPVVSHAARSGPSAALNQQGARNRTRLPVGGLLKDTWLARANLKQAKARHDRMIVVQAEEFKWIYDQRVMIKGSITAEDDCKSLLLMGLGQGDYNGLATSVQGEYKKSDNTACGRPVYVRLGGMALWFAKDCDGCSQPSHKEKGDDGEWWIGPEDAVGQNADILLGPPARGVLRVRDSAVNPAKIFRTWRVYRP